MEANVEWLWEPRYHRAFLELKRLVSETPVLRFYDVNRPVTLATDASKHGYGAVIMQAGQPVAFASMRTSKAGQNYAPIENEISAIVFGCTRFHDYVYGQQLTVETDHKPLVGIFRKPLNKLSPMLRCIRLKLLRCNLNVVWKPGNDTFILDALSRAVSENAPGTPYYERSIWHCKKMAYLFAGVD